MADRRYQDRPYPSDDYDRGGDQYGRADNDPLAELARLIGQTDPFATQGRPAARPPTPPAPEPYQPPPHAQSYAPESYEDHQYEEPPPPPGPPSWMRRANVQPQPPVAEQPRYAPAVNSEHPLQRFPAQQSAPEPDYQEPQAYPEHDDPIDPSRYDDALYGQLEAGQQDFQRDPSYPDDPYAYQSDYPEDELEDEAPQKKRGGLMTVAAILALAVVGTGGAFAYKTYLGSPRSGEPPIIKADNTPTKVVPAPADGSAKVPDRMVTGDGSEKIVPREEAPIDVNARSGGPRVVFPPLNPNANPPPVASVSPSAVPPPSAAPNNGTMPNSEPRRVRTLAVKGDQTDSTPAPAAAAAKQAAAPKAAAATAAPRNPPTSANASANQPMSLAPQAGTPDPSAPPTRIAATNPTQIAPAPAEGGGSYMVSISSQDTESAARDSFRVLQGKFPSALGSRSPVIKRVDLADNKVKYRAMVGPYRTRQEAAQFCTELKAAGGQCFIP
ncbi:SPOR domain-containing protein [Bradyrhizobium sp. Ec3.3]|uniref:SPOR domain-containing protein n=1 Tax=Bradyrhizobium sp. Ec3.3 TaxID=189753 RepID=UPI0004893696|nr:SPOR domain-containing protein [Bradyrhizobium sp. Ec3.3]